MESIWKDIQNMNVTLNNHRSSCFGNCSSIPLGLAAKSDFYRRATPAAKDSTLAAVSGCC